MSCSAPDQGDVVLPPATSDTSGVVAGAADGQTVVEGQVHAGGAPVVGAYVTLLDAEGEFTAEVVSGPGGQFRFYAAPGLWTVRALAPGGRAARTVEAVAGRTRIDLPLGAVPAGPA